MELDQARLRFGRFSDRLPSRDEPTVEVEGDRFGKADPFEIGMGRVQDVVQFADNDRGNRQDCGPPLFYLPVPNALGSKLLSRVESHPV